MFRYFNIILLEMIKEIFFCILHLICICYSRHILHDNEILILFQSAPGEVEQAVKDAIDVGYRHFDCAMLYGNEAEIGSAIREKIAEGAVTREELFVVTKLWNTFHEKHLVVPTCKKSLENFGLDYIDQYLIHWPVAQKTVGELNVSFPFSNAYGIDYDYVETWKGMEECVKLGLTKGIGLSNFNSKQIERVLNAATIKPVVNQVRTKINNGFVVYYPCVRF